MRKLLGIAFMAIINCGSLFAQTETWFAVTDKQPALANGLEMGYAIKSTEVKSVSDKGNFSRYSVRFFVTNKSGEAKIILYKQGLNIFNNVSDQLAKFNCANATGARLTSKTATISATPCNVLALVDDTDPKTNKTNQNKRFVQIGYWIQAGQTISADCILITPLNELPNVSVSYLANQMQPTGSASYGGPQQAQAAQTQREPPVQYNTVGFIKIRNVLNNSYLNEQTGLPASTTIDAGWWSAQWSLVAIPGTGNYYLKNRWKENYLGTDAGNLTVTGDYSKPSTAWVMITTSDQDIVRFKNAQTGGYLGIAYNSLVILKPAAADLKSASWQLEKP